MYVILLRNRIVNVLMSGLCVFSSSFFFISHQNWLHNMITQEEKDIQK